MKEPPPFTSFRQGEGREGVMASGRPIRICANWTGTYGIINMGPPTARQPAFVPTCFAGELDQDVEVISAAPSLPSLHSSRQGRRPFLAFLRSSEVVGFSFLLLVMRTRSSTVTESAATEKWLYGWKSASLAWSTQRFPLARKGPRRIHATSFPEYNILHV